MLGNQFHCGIAVYQIDGFFWQSQFEQPLLRLVLKGAIIMAIFTKIGGKIFKFSGRATVDGEVAAEAEFSAYVDWDMEKTT